jgi:hypothetical protein
MSTEKLTVVGHLKALAQRLQDTRNTVSQLAQATTAAIDELDTKVSSLTDGDTLTYGDGDTEVYGT